MTSDSGFSHATSKSDLDEQRLKREEEIRQIAIKRAERVKKQEEARARLERDGEAQDGGENSRQAKVLAKQANDKDAAGTSNPARARAAPPPWRRLPEHEPDPNAEYPDTAEGYATCTPWTSWWWTASFSWRESRGGPSRGSPCRRRVAFAARGGRRPPPAGCSLRRGGEARAPVGANPGRGSPSPAKSRPPPTVRTTENYTLKQKKEKEAAARAKENEERRKEQERKAKAQAQRAANLKKEVELNKKLKEEKERRARRSSRRRRPRRRKRS